MNFNSLNASPQQVPIPDLFQVFSFEEIGVRKALNLDEEEKVLLNYSDKKSDAIKEKR